LFFLLVDRKYVWKRRRREKKISKSLFPKGFSVSAFFYRNKIENRKKTHLNRGKKEFNKIKDLLLISL